METNRSKYRIENYRFTELEDTVILPSFQRKLVWSKNEKKNFIETLHNGYPFGAILVYRYPNEKKISLIDGLQRFTTIRDFRDHPQEYIPINHIIDRTFTLFTTQDTPVSTATNYKNRIEKILKDFISTLDTSTKSTALLDALLENLSDLSTAINNNMREILDIQDDLSSLIKDYLDISQIDIPTIIFTGSDTELATVFENLNRGGKKLSKYQVFAAQWYKYEVTLSIDLPNNIELLNRTITWYEKLEDDRGIEIENFDPDKMRDEAKINIAELCFVFGQMILENTPVFWKGAKDDTANEIGYSTMAIILGIKNKDLSTIIAEANLPLFNNPKLLEETIKSVLTIYRDINALFQNYLHTPGNLTDFKHALGTNFQILSFFASLWNARYELNPSRTSLQTKRGSNKDCNLIKSNLLKWYISDIIEGYWSGTGDSKLDLVAIEKNNKYLNTVPTENINNSLKKWYDEQLQKRSINFEATAKMLYTINASFDSTSYTGTNYDLEHVIPKKLINQITSKALISGGTLGNLMFLDSSTNRAKKEQFLYNYVNDDAYELKKEFIDLNFYPSKKSLINAKIELEAKGNDYSNTQSLIKTRGNDIINSLVKNLG